MKRIINLAIVIAVSLNMSCKDSQPNKNYVLVHGAYHGKWCWDYVVPLLEKDGNKVYAINLPGHGSDTTAPENVTLELYKNKILQTIKSIDGKVTLIGHSLGGVSISLAAEQVPDKIESLIYLTAVLPIDGESAFSAASLDPNPNETVFYEISEDQKTVKVIPELAKDIFYNDCSDEDKEFGLSNLSVQAMEPFLAPVNLSHERFGSIPKYYIETLKDAALSIEVQRLWHQRTECEAVLSLDSGHSPFFSMPQELADMILAIN
jgi:pimeloyl-ACP methyl ester carboxylesterase